jgi:hypothetical protein
LDGAAILSVGRIGMDSATGSRDVSNDGGGNDTDDSSRIVRSTLVMMDLGTANWDGEFGIDVTFSPTGMESNVLLFQLEAVDGDEDHWSVVDVNLIVVLGRGWVDGRLWTTFVFGSGDDDDEDTADDAIDAK